MTRYENGAGTLEYAGLETTTRLLTEIRDLLAEQSAGALGRKAAARFLGISTSTLDRLTNAGKLKSVRVSEGRVAWLRSELQKYLDALAE